MVSNTYFPALGGSLLDEPVDNAEIFNPMTQCLLCQELNVGMRTKNHVISLVESEKKALSPIDMKHWIWLDCISSLPCIFKYIRNFLSVVQVMRKKKK
ncbi:uncharacterized protein OCT59_018721 [Rhizophagus irregularis]|uniref:uncharacterized protein n=1 Tax=Rhizophagus irregularis TaxID=588596 RepID=UPI00331C4917|nr:hypothetical protein OCT59_018721 [Rhizophagus irregularis]